MILRLLILLTSIQLVVSHDWKVDFDLPLSWLDSVVETYPPGLGEPLNVVLSAQSSPEVLTRRTFEDYLKSVGYADECFGIHVGHKQSADLNDGAGMKEQAGLYRWAYRLVEHAGTCYESLNGGSHLRYWFQQSTGAVFMAVSNEHNATLNHGIVENGYDLGRDTFVGNATIPGGTTSPSSGLRFSTTSRLVPGFLKPGFDGLNHYVAVDGNVAIITVTILVDSDVSRAMTWPTAVTSVGASLLALALSCFALKPSSKGRGRPPPHLDGRDIHFRRHQQLLLALQEAR